MSEWKANKTAKIPDLNNPVLIEGLPGIGNVGKIAADFIIKELKAKKILTFSSESLSHSVFINKDNLVVLPEIALYHCNVDSQDILLLAGNTQPTESRACYQFCRELNDFAERYNVKEIITLGGIGLREIPKKPKVYATGNSTDLLDEYRKYGLGMDLHSQVGPIIGVSGLLVGLAKVPSVALLAETFAHPAFQGGKGAQESLKVLKQRFNLPIPVEKLNSETAEEKLLKKAEQMIKTAKAEDKTEYIG